MPQDILLKRLHKRRHLTYGPPPGEGDPRGTLFLDDLHAPAPDAAGRVNLHEVRKKEREKKRNDNFW